MREYKKEKEGKSQSQNRKENLKEKGEAKLKFGVHESLVTKIMPISIRSANVDVCKMVA